ncbi:hypothetical protein EV361DRAFT_902702 [Lentinula raphanica]|nr:hypothetical protein EV361DRAFT_902702 [Lentinula raphanica]
MRLLSIFAFYFSFLWGPAHIFAAPVTTRNPSVQVHSNEDLEPTLPNLTTIHPRNYNLDVGDTSGPDIRLSLQLNIYTEDDVEAEVFPVEYADKFRNAAEILLPWFLPILDATDFLEDDRDHITMMELPNNRLSFRATELFYNESDVTSPRDRHDQNYYKMGVKVFFKGDHLDRYDHTLYFLKSVFAQARSPLGVAEAVRLEGGGGNADPHSYRFVGFIHGRYGATFQRSTSFRNLDRGPFEKFQPEKSKWKQNTKEIKKTVVPSTIDNAKKVAIFDFQTVTVKEKAKAKVQSWKKQVKGMYYNVF